MQNLYKPKKNANNLVHTALGQWFILRPLMVIQKDVVQKSRPDYKESIIHVFTQKAHCL